MSSPRPPVPLPPSNGMQHRRQPRRTTSWHTPKEATRHDKTGENRGPYNLVQAFGRQMIEDGEEIPEVGEGGVGALLGFRRGRLRGAGGAAQHVCDESLTPI
jgi:hypothetical protein